VSSNVRNFMYTGIKFFTYGNIFIGLVFLLSSWPPSGLLSTLVFLLAIIVLMTSMGSIKKVKYTNIFFLISLPVVILALIIIATINPDLSVELFLLSLLSPLSWAPIIYLILCYFYYSGKEVSRYFNT
jgi:hypothetical protein